MEARIMIIEDEAHIISTLKRNIRNYNTKNKSRIEVISLNTNEIKLDPDLLRENLKRFNAETIDLFIIDYVMPRMNGLEVAAVVRENIRVPIVIYTGKGDEKTAGLFSQLIQNCIYYLKSDSVAGLIGIVVDKIKTHRHLMAQEREINAHINNLEQSVAKRTHELETSENNYRNLIAHMNDLLLTTDLQDRITFVSQSADAFLGYQPQDIANRSLLDFILPEDIQIVKADLEAIRSLMPEKENTSGIPASFRLVTKDRGDMLVDSRARPLRNLNGEIIGIIWLWRDITPLHKIEAEKETLKRQLQRVQMTEAPGGTITGTTHEFNDILDVIKNHTQTALSHSGDLSLAIKSLQSINDQVARWQQIINQQQSGGLQLESVSLVGLIEELIGDLLKEQRKQGIKHQLVFAGQGRIKADPAKLRGALLELLTEAAAAMPAGGTITVRTNETDKRVAVEFTVTGDGVESERLHRTFASFPPLAKLPEESEPLTSELGVSGSQDIIAAHHGEIQVFDQDDKGVSVIIKLPRDKD